MIITISNQVNVELEYIINTLIRNFLGIDFQLNYGEVNGVEISSHGKVMKMPLPFFCVSKWLSDVSLPKQPLSHWDVSSLDFDCKVTDKLVPVIYGKPSININKDSIDIGIDIFGSCFFMLSRYEEVIKTQRDSYDRFPAKASLAYQEGFLMRPIVNEYLEILWSCMKYLWPTLKRKNREFRTLVSCDVDFINAPSLYSIPKFVKRLGGDILKRHSPTDFIISLISFVKVQLRGESEDPYFTFNYLMSVCERYRLKNAFYFICDHSNLKMDGECYNMNSKKVRALLSEIHERGHEIGLHTSFDTYKNRKQTRKEFNILLDVCKQEGIIQKEWGGRQHYLRWKSSQTAVNWSQAGLNYDSTLGYADHVGFRCGTCYEYPLYDLENRKVLSVVERPLILMECSLIDDKYMGKGYTKEAYQIANDLKSKCRLYDGDFTLLWHNSSFENINDRNLFEFILK